MRTELETLAMKRALKKVGEAHELCITAWNKCKLGNMGTQSEHPLYQAYRACVDAEQWLKACLDSAD